MHEVVVADASGLLVTAGLVEGIAQDAAELVALDATALLIAEYLVLRHEGAPERAGLELDLATAVVQEWFPVRAVAVAAALRTGADGDSLTTASLELAETLDLPLLTRRRDAVSSKVPVLYC